MNPRLKRKFLIAAAVLAVGGGGYYHFFVDKPLSRKERQAVIQALNSQKIAEEHGIEVTDTTLGRPILAEFEGMQPDSILTQEKLDSIWTDVKRLSGVDLQRPRFEPIVREGQGKEGDSIFIGGRGRTTDYFYRRAMIFEKTRAPGKQFLRKVIKR